MKTKPIPLPTYAIIILSGWPSILDIVSKYTRVKKQSIKFDLPLLSTEQLEEVFMDKQNHFIQYSITLRVKLLLAFIQINQQVNALLNIENETRQALFSLERLLKEDKNNTELIEEIEITKNFLSDIKSALTQLSEKQETFSIFNEKIDHILQKHDQMWGEFRQQWSITLIEELEKIGIKLTTLEKTDIHRQKTLAELIERMKELGLSLPKDIQAL